MMRVTVSWVRFCTISDSFFDARGFSNPSIMMAWSNGISLFPADCSMGTGALPEVDVSSGWPMATALHRRERVRMAVLFIRGRQKVGLVIKMLFRCDRNKDSERRGLRQMKTRVLNFGRAEPTPIFYKDSETCPHTDGLRRNNASCWK